MLNDVCDIVITTWPNHPARIEYIQRMLESLANHLVSSPIRRRYCSAETERDPLHKWCGDDLKVLCKYFKLILQWHDEPADLGRNMNTALRLGDADYIFLVQDDFSLLEQLDITAGIELLSHHSDIAAVRYHYSHRTEFNGLVEGTVFRQVQMNGPWPFSDSGQLRRRSFVQQYGEYLEDCRHGGSESRMVRNLRTRGAQIAAYQHNIFKHIGLVPAVIKDERLHGIHARDMDDDSESRAAIAHK